MVIININNLNLIYYSQMVAVSNRNTDNQKFKFQYPLLWGFWSAEYWLLVKRARKEHDFHRAWESRFHLECMRWLCDLQWFLWRKEGNFFQVPHAACEDFSLQDTSFCHGHSLDSRFHTQELEVTIAWHALLILREFLQVHHFLMKA